MSSTPGTLPTLGAELERWERERALSGSVLVTSRGHTVFEGSYGYADRASGTRVTPATRFGLASVTKMFTAVLVVDLVARTSLSFRTRVIDVLPADRRPATLLPEVTVHHLLCHTSGIADYCEEDPESPLHVEDYGSLWDLRPSYRMLRPIDFLPMFSHLPPYRPPGQRFQYSNAGYIVLGQVIEEVTGSAYADGVRGRVFDRAGMADSGFFRLDEAVPDVAVGYLPRADPAAPWRSNVYSIPVVGGPDGGAYSTARDLDRFLHAYGDGTLLGRNRERVLTPHADAGDGFAEGYGVHLYPDGRFGHDGGDPGFEAMVNCWPAEGLHIVVLCNGEGLASQVRDLVVMAWAAGT